MAQNSHQLTEIPHYNPTGEDQIFAVKLKNQPYTLVYEAKKISFNLLENPNDKHRPLLFIQKEFARRADSKKLKDLLAENCLTDLCPTFINEQDAQDKTKYTFILYIAFARMMFDKSFTEQQADFHANYRDIKSLPAQERHLLALKIVDQYIRLLYDEVIKNKNDDLQNLCSLFNYYIIEYGEHIAPFSVDSINKVNKLYNETFKSTVQPAITSTPSQSSSSSSSTSSNTASNNKTLQASYEDPNIAKLQSFIKDLQQLNSIPDMDQKTKSLISIINNANNLLQKSDSYTLRTQNTIKKSTYTGFDLFNEATVVNTTIANPLTEIRKRLGDTSLASSEKFKEIAEIVKIKFDTLQEKLNSYVNTGKSKDNFEFQYLSTLRDFYESLQTVITKALSPTNTATSNQAHPNNNH
jgi:hypothetical protein